MVGTVLLKDFNTGSYEQMRITVFEGSAFADIERAGEYSSYKLNNTTRTITLDCKSSDAAPCAEKADIYRIGRAAAEYLCEDWDATIFRFVLSGNTVRLSCESHKSGVYLPPDIRAAFTPSVMDMYKLICDIGDKSILYASLLCDALNEAVCRLFVTEEPMFAYAAGGIYINTALFMHSRRAMNALGVPRDIRLLNRTKRKRRHMLRFDSRISPLPQMEVLRGVRTGYYDIVHKLRSFKLAVHRLVETCIPPDRKPGAVAEYISSLAQNGHITQLCYELCEEMADFGAMLFYNSESEKHIYALSLRDILRLACGMENHDKYVKKAHNAYKNYKLHSRLPCPDYYDSHGRAYWTKG